VTQKIRITFLLIAVTQGLHSIEEAYGKLWEVFPPAKFVSGLVSDNLETGFVIINVTLFVVLALISLSTFSKHFSANALLWFWLVLETINGTGHIIWAIMEQSYTPGLITAPLLLFLALYLGRLLIKSNV